MGHKAANCLSATWNNQGNIQRSGMGNNPTAQQGHPLAGGSLGNNRDCKKPQAEGRALKRDSTKAVPGSPPINHLYARNLVDF